MKRFFLCLFLVFSLFLNAKESIILGCREGAGMFSLWMDVLTLCREYDRGNLRGIKVDFGKGGLYYCEAHGENWWEYFCEPIKHGKLKNARFVIGDIPGKQTHPGGIEFNITRKEANVLIKKYIHIKPFVQQRIDNFVNEHFKGRSVISVHYRGTDKINEAPYVPYEKVYNMLKLVIPTNRDYRIFIATDDINFIVFMQSCFGDKVCYQEAFRTDGKQGIHYMNVDKYQIGLEALTDMILLSKADLMIRTSSNLSKWSSWWDPYVTVMELNQRHGM